MRWLFLCAMLLGLCVARSAAQTSQPSDDPWSALSQEFAKALGQGDAAALVPLLSEGVTIDCFDSRGGDAVRLLARVKAGTLVATCAYPHGAFTLASDLAEQIRSSQLPDDLKRRMTPSDEPAAHRANGTAALWIAQTLSAKNDDPMGVAVFWCAGGSAGEDDPAKAELVFVAFRGESAKLDPARITAIAFGNPLNQNR